MLGESTFTLLTQVVFSTAHTGPGGPALDSLPEVPTRRSTGRRLRRSVAVLSFPLPSCLRISSETHLREIKCNCTSRAHPEATRWHHMPRKKKKHAGRTCHNCQDQHQQHCTGLPLLSSTLTLHGTTCRSCTSPPQFLATISTSLLPAAAGTTSFQSLFRLSEERQQGTRATHLSFLPATPPHGISKPPPYTIRPTPHLSHPPLSGPLTSTTLMSMALSTTRSPLW